MIEPFNEFTYCDTATYENTSEDTDKDEFHPKWSDVKYFIDD